MSHLYALFYFHFVINVIIVICKFLFTFSLHQHLKPSPLETQHYRNVTSVCVFFYILPFGICNHLQKMVILHAHYLCVVLVSCHTIMERDQGSSHTPSGLLAIPCQQHISLLQQSARDGSCLYHTGFSDAARAFDVRCRP